VALDYLTFFAAALAGYLALYLLTNGACSWLYSSGWWGNWSSCRIQPDRTARPGQVGREIRLSVMNLPIFATSATIAYAFYRQGWTRIYLDLAGTSWLYFAFTVLLLIAIHDTYFYWMHRLLHWKPLFRHVHRLHHLSLTPTSWACYATHPVEGMLMSGDLLLFPLLFPVHPLAIVLFLILQMIYSTLGHSGYDTFPRVFRRHWTLAWHNTPSHHDDHHRYVQGNFGHFLNVWDWLMRTELPHGDLVRERARQGLEGPPRVETAGGTGQDGPSPARGGPVAV
jgi:Delta7-sterol 5-desaturase